MRIALALVLAAMPALGLPMAARAADTAQDRYGPPPPLRMPAPAAATVSYPTPDSVAREEASVAAEASGYHGRMLTWAGKGGARRAPAASAQAAAVQQAAAAPLRREALPIQPPGAPPPRSAPLPRSLYGDAPAT
ncbi:MAG: hypothetical protein JSR86_21425, partial [Proteobacteria bacterium]|nr:hypothetical protein [Pseudomonadota bacterium]